MPSLARDPVDPVTRGLLHSVARTHSVGVGKSFRGIISGARFAPMDGYVRVQGQLGRDPMHTSYVINCRQLTDEVGTLLVLVETRNSVYLAWVPERDYATYVANKSKYKVED